MRKIRRVRLVLWKIRSVVRELLALMVKDSKAICEGSALLRRLNPLKLLDEASQALEHVLSLKVHAGLPRMLPPDARCRARAYQNHPPLARLIVRVERSSST